MSDQKRDTSKPHKIEEGGYTPAPGAKPPNTPPPKPSDSGPSAKPPRR